MYEKLAIGIDLGCTNIKGVLLNSEGLVLAEEKQDTVEHDDDHWKSLVKKMIAGFRVHAKQDVHAIGLSAPGLADVANSCISFMPGRLPGLEKFDWTSWVGERVYVLNDAHAALMAETTFGAAKNMQHAVLLSLGTGIGGGILIHGELYQGVSQMAGHIGHTTIDATDTSHDVTNMIGSIEDAFGNVSLSRRSHGKYHSTDALVDDYLKADPFASWVWLTSIQKLAVSIASTINILSPEAVILSGGITRAREALLEPLNSFLQLYEWRPGGKRTLIKLARFSELPGAIGAAGFALSKTNKKA
ncbi:MAG: ROK family protein [Chryseolinea sp.]